MMTVMSSTVLLLDELRLDSGVEAVTAIDWTVALRLGRQGGGGTMELGETSINWAWS